MINLAPYITNGYAEFVSIVNDKNDPRHTRLLNLLNVINTRYQLYSQSFTTTLLQNIPRINLTQQEKEDLLHCYTGATASLNNLVRNIRETQPLHIRGTCQYCGINSDNSIDHYLPKGQYPDFCVYVLNLLPCCESCNSFKWEYWINNQTNNRGIINLYLDNLPIVQFLFLNIGYNNNVPNATFSISNVNAIPPQLYSIIETHFERLNLLERYKLSFHSIYHQTYKSFKNNATFLNNPNLVRDLLEHDANQLLADFGANYWKGIIKLTLSTDQTFLTLCST